MRFRAWVEEDGVVRTNREFPKTKVAAIRASIKKWEVIRDYLDENGPSLWVENYGGGTCALCELYFDESMESEFNEEESKPCLKCPVYKRTGEHQCMGTPFYLFHELEGTPGAPQAAQQEVDFLKSLLENK